MSKECIWRDCLLLWVCTRTSTVIPNTIDYNVYLKRWLLWLSVSKSKYHTTLMTKISAWWSTYCVWVWTRASIDFISSKCPSSTMRSASSNTKHFKLLRSRKCCSPFNEKNKNIRLKWNDFWRYIVYSVIQYLCHSTYNYYYIFFDPLSPHAFFCLIIVTPFVLPELYNHIQILYLCYGRSR